MRRARVLVCRCHHVALVHRGRCQECRRLGFSCPGFVSNDVERDAERSDVMPTQIALFPEAMERAA